MFIPLMNNNITKEDLNELITFLQADPRLTNGPKVREFESSWSSWLGTEHTLMVNSGSSANYLTIEALKIASTERGDLRDEIIVPPLTWISDIASVIRAGYKPVVCDITLENLALDIDQIKRVTTKKTRAIFLTHVLGFNGLSKELLDFCKKENIDLIEDCCESHGAMFNGKKIGQFGIMSNFSFYFAHHMSTIEGGCISTNENTYYQIMRTLRSHGMLREADDNNFKRSWEKKATGVNPEFIFPYMGYNFRSTEINAVLGLSQLKTLDDRNILRNKNFEYLLDLLDRDKFFLDFDTQGMSNYAFILILRSPDDKLMQRVCNTLNDMEVEYRRGLSGGGNQLRQPYLKNLIQWDAKDFKNVEFVHDYGMYIGNYPGLESEKIEKLATELNKL